MSITAVTTVPEEERDSFYRQSVLSEFGMDFSPYKAKVSRENLEANIGGNIYLTGDPLETGILGSPEYDRIDLIVATHEKSYPEDSIRSFPSRQYVESHFMEKEDIGSLEEVFRALEGEESDFWDERDFIPLQSDFSFGGTDFRIRRMRDSSGIEGILYPLEDYKERSKRPCRGVRRSLKPFRENIGKEDTDSFNLLVDSLKDIGATLYVTGSIMETADYDDIDISVDALSYPRESNINRIEDSPYKKISDYRGLPRRLGVEKSDVEHGLEKHEEIDLVDVINPENNEVSHGYNALSYLFRVRVGGTEFDIGYDEEPFHPDSSGRDLEGDIEFAKI